MHASERGVRVRNCLIAFSLTAVALAAMDQALRADGVVRDGIGAISTGRGGTNIAHSDNGAVLLDNPAGIVNIPERGLFEFSIDSVVTDIDYADAETSTNAKFRPMPLPEVTYIFKDPCGCWAFGLGVYAPAGFGADYEQVNPIVGRRDYKSLGALGKILPAAAVRVTDRLSIGGTFGLALSHAEIEGPFFLQTGALAGAPTVFDLQGTGAAPAWSLGAQYKLSDRTTVGVAYTSETRFKLNGSLNAAVYGLGPDPVEGRFDAETDLVWPRSLGFGLTHRLCECQRISAEVIWFDWSHAFDQVDIKLTNSTNPLFTGLLGPTIRDSFPLNWRDTYSLRLGYEYFASPCSTWRAGYVYHADPVPQNTLTTYIPGILEHAFSLGHGRRWGRDSIDVSYQYSFGPERHVGQSAILGNDFDNSEIKAQAHWLQVGFTRRF